MTDRPTGAPTEEPRTLAELDRLAEPLHARVITREGMETMTRLAYEKGLAEARASASLDVERLRQTERHAAARNGGRVAARDRSSGSAVRAAREALDGN